MLPQIAWTVSIDIKRGQSLRKGRYGQTSNLSASKVSGGSQNHSAYSHSSHLLQNLPSLHLSLVFNTFWTATPVFSLHGTVLNVVLYSSLLLCSDYPLRWIETWRLSFMTPPGPTSSETCLKVTLCTAERVLHEQCIKEAEVVVRPLISLSSAFNCPPPLCTFTHP